EPGLVARLLEHGATVTEDRLRRGEVPSQLLDVAEDAPGIVGSRIGLAELLVDHRRFVHEVTALVDSAVEAHQSAEEDENVGSAHALVRVLEQLVAAGDRLRDGDRSVVQGRGERDQAPGRRPAGPEVVDERLLRGAAPLLVPRLHTAPDVADMPPGPPEGTIVL